MKQILLSIIFIIGFTSFVKGELEENNHFSFATNDKEDNEIRSKRDVLKGKDHDLVRIKRYIGRVPASYMKKALIPGEIEPYIDDQDDYIQSEINQNAPVLSHFRESQKLGISDISNHNVGRNFNFKPRVLSDRIQFANIRPSARKELNDEINSLSDDEIQMLLLMLDGSSQPQQHRWTPEEIQAIMETYIRPRMGVGKRETGKRSPRTYEQPMSFDNALFTDGDRVEFLNDKRSKRVGTRDLIAKTSAQNRFQRETNPAVLAALSRVFPQDNKQNLEKAPIMENEQGDAPSDSHHHHQQQKSSMTKKDVDWSYYLGIDKKNIETADASIQKSNQGTKGESGKVETQSAGSIASLRNPSKLRMTGADTPIAIGLANKVTKENKESIKKAEEKKENEVVNKEDDRDWVLEQFYKNFAMSTNVKRKRESPSLKSQNDLDKLEKLENKMAEAGDKIIWDALKYTGSQRDANLSPKELAEVKNEIIQKLSAAYSLEKVREAVDELRSQISTLEKSVQE